MQATAHIDFVLAAYAAGIIVVGALVAWVMLDYRMQRLTLAELEMQGVSRRSATARAEPVKRTAKEGA
jgi:heme exporter protein CcmD